MRVFLFCVSFVWGRWDLAHLSDEPTGRVVFRDLATFHEAQWDQGLCSIDHRHGECRAHGRDPGRFQKSVWDRLSFDQLALSRSFWSQCCSRCPSFQQRHGDRWRAGN